MKTITKMSSPIHELFREGWSEVTSGARNEIVFERLNKTYGAYDIRTNYDNTLLKAFSWAGLFILLLSTIMLFSRSIPLPEKKIPAYDPVEFKKMEKEKEKVIIETRQEMKADPNKNMKALVPEVDKDSTPDLDSLPALLSFNNRNSTNGNDTGSTGPDPGLGGPSGGGKLFDEDTTTYDGPILEEPPTFPGGDPALFGYLKKNVYYPESVKEMGGKGLVGVSFIIDKEGYVTGVKLVKGCRYTELNNEALRVITNLPKWNPGMQQGRPVKVRMILPIRFELKQ